MFVRFVIVLLVAVSAYGQEPDYKALKAAEIARGDRLKSQLETVAEMRKVVASDLEDADQELEDARADLQQLANGYAGRGGGVVPSDRALPELMEQLTQATDHAAYERDLERIEARIAEWTRLREELELSLDSMATRRRAASDAFLKNNKIEEWAKREAGEFDKIQSRERQGIVRLEPIVRDALTDLASTRVRRHDLQETRLEELRLLRRENLGIRSPSALTWESVKQGGADLARLPGWISATAREVWAYARSHGASVLRVGGIGLLGLVLLLLLRRFHRSRVRRVEATEGAVSHKLVLAALGTRLLLVLGTAFLLVAIPYSCAGLPDVSEGARIFLQRLGVVLGGFWLARSAARLILRPSTPQTALLDLDPEESAKLWRNVSLLLDLFVLYLPAIYALRYLGYANLGALEAHQLVLQTVAGILLVSMLLRHRVLKNLVPADRRGFGVRAYHWALRYLRPLVVVLIPGTLVLVMLRYDVLAYFVVTTAVSTLIAFVVGAVLYRVLGAIVEARLEATYPVDAGDDALRRRDAASAAGKYLLWIVALFVTTACFNALAEFDLRDLIAMLDVPIPLQGTDGRQITWWNIIAGLVIGFIVLTGMRPARLALRELLLSRTRLDSGLQYTITKLFGYVFATGGILLACSQVFNLSSLAYIAAALSVGIGFGLQEIVSNFISGLILLFERPLKVGDLVQFGQDEGVVRQINIRATTVETRDNIVMLVPNKEFITQAVVNFVHGDPKIRLHVAVGVSYGSDVEKVKSVLLDVATANNVVLNRPPPEVWFRNFGDSSLDFELLVWIRNPILRNRITSDLNFAIFKAFRTNDIEIPFPQRDLHVRDATPFRVLGSDDHEKGGEAEAPPPSTH